MSNNEFELFSWCREHDFAGHDPFDALNSRSFRHTAGQITQRTIYLDPARQKIAADLRGVARSRAAQCERNRLVRARATRDQRLPRTIRSRSAPVVVRCLLSMKVDGYSGAAWGYNFDWQSRNFSRRAGTPTIVPTAFAARALIEAA